MEGRSIQNLVAAILKYSAKQRQKGTPEGDELEKLLETTPGRDEFVQARRRIPEREDVDVVFRRPEDPSKTGPAARAQTMLETENVPKELSPEEQVESLAPRVPRSPHNEFEEVSQRSIPVDEIVKRAKVRTGSSIDLEGEASAAEIKKIAERPREYTDIPQEITRAKNTSVIPEENVSGPRPSTAKDSVELIRERAVEESPDFVARQQLQSLEEQTRGMFQALKAGDAQMGEPLEFSTSFRQPLMENLVAAREAVEGGATDIQKFLDRFEKIGPRRWMTVLTRDHIPLRDFDQLGPMEDAGQVKAYSLLDAIERLNLQKKLLPEVTNPSREEIARRKGMTLEAFNKKHPVAQEFQAQESLSNAPPERPLAKFRPPANESEKNIRLLDIMRRRIRKTQESLKRSEN